MSSTVLTIVASYIYNLLLSSIDKQYYQLLNTTHPREWGFPIISGWGVGFPSYVVHGGKRRAEIVIIEQ